MLVRRLRLDHRLPDFNTAVGAFIGEVDLRQAPVRFDVLHIHGKPDTARTNDEGGFDVMMADIGWHVGSPQRSIHQWPQSRTKGYAAAAATIMNSCEHTKNSHTI